MSDIHVLEGRIQDEDRAVYRFVFHIPTNADLGLRTNAMNDPAVSEFVSILGDSITPTELDNIRAAVLVEYDDTITYHKNDSPAEYLVRLQEMWAELAATIPGDFERTYQWYLNTYNAT